MTLKQSMYFENADLTETLKKVFHLIAISDEFLVCCSPIIEHDFALVFNLLVDKVGFPIILRII